jgi:hypothetical protein
MKKQKINKRTCPRIFRAISQIYRDGNPVQTMILLADLADLGIKHGLIDNEQRAMLLQLHLILGEVAIFREKQGMK